MSPASSTRWPKATGLHEVPSDRAVGHPELTRPGSPDGKVAGGSEAGAITRLDPVSRTIAEELFKEIRARLRFLIDVGLHYLALDRAAPTLSGGEAQRIRLASQVGAGLVGVLYILDEPSIGLHPRDNDRLLATLRRLSRLGNTVVVVEHDEDTMRAADHLVDFGPGPGVKGGKVIAEGTIDDLARLRQSLTVRIPGGQEDDSDSAGASSPMGDSSRSKAPGTTISRTSIRRFRSGFLFA